MKYLATIIFTLCTIGLVQGQTPNFDSLKVSSFVDSLFKKGVNEGYIPGGIIGIVHQNQTVIANAYGYANIENKISVDFNSTRFQLGSVGKLFTAIAVLKEVEKGRLSLDLDVNTYLKEFKVDNFKNQPITLRHLLTHSAGLNERLIGYAARSKNDLTPLGEHLKDRMPKTYTAPGTAVSYSNYGFGLAGHLVELSSGKGFVDYINDEIFQQLGMSSATYELPNENERGFAIGYDLNEQFDKVKPFSRHVIPAGSVAATGADLIKFLKAILNEERRLLSLESFELLKTEQFTMHSLLTGNAFGIEMQNFNGHTGAGKAGVIPGFLAYITYLPQYEFGMFTAVNTQTDNFLEHFTAAFTDQFLPEKTVFKTPVVNVELAKFTGVYRVNRYNRNTVEDVFELVAGTFKIGSVADSALWCYHNGKVQYYKPIEPLVFQNTEMPNSYMVFKQGENGKVSQVFRNEIAAGINVPSVYEKLPWYDTVNFINEYYGFIPIFVFTFLLAPFYWLMIWLIRRKKESFMEGKTLQKSSKIIALLLSLAFVAHLLFSLIPLFRAGIGIMYGIPNSIQIVQGFTFLLPVLLVILMYRTFKIWIKKESRLATRIYYSLFTVCALIHVLFLNHWHFIGMNF
jgi:CubicO group peptidase (beta-lactamase class C family)